MDTRFKVLTDMRLLEQRTVPLADPTLVVPTTALYLFQGEWLTWNGTTLGRLAAPGVSAMSFPSIEAEFQSDSRALGAISTLWGGSYEFLTSMYDILNIPATVGAACYVNLLAAPSVAPQLSRQMISSVVTGSVIARVTATVSGGFLRCIRIWT